MFDLGGRTCLVTGASSGFGAHFARLLAGAGARVVVAARRTDRVEALADELGERAFAVAMDVASEQSVIAAYDAAEAHFGPVDTVIANAGVAGSARSIAMPASDAQQLLDTNVLGLFLTAREGARRMIAADMRESGRGRIVLIGSMGARMLLPGQAMYCASKAAVEHLGRNLAREWVGQGINVNVIEPGYIATGINDEWFATERGKAQIAGLQRRRLQPIASLDWPLLYFCSDASASATGSIFGIDDGQSL